MRCKILHESKNRMRVHLFRKYMSCDEADKVEYFLLSLPYVDEVKVSERTSDAVIRYNDRKRELLINELAHFDLASTEVAVPEHTGREPECSGLSQEGPCQDLHFRYRSEESSQQ